jgi:hypothetical protein
MTGRQIGLIVLGAVLGSLAVLLVLSLLGNKGSANLGGVAGGAGGAVTGWLAGKKPGKHF